MPLRLSLFVACLKSCFYGLDKALLDLPKRRGAGKREASVRNVVVADQHSWPDAPLPNASAFEGSVRNNSNQTKKDQLQVSARKHVGSGREQMNVKKRVR